MHDATAVFHPITTHQDEFALDVLRGFSARQKQLPPKYFYDSYGSKLFEAICQTPEYYVTRTEHEILCRNAAKIAEKIPAGSSLVEFGSGNSMKTKLIIDALLKRNRTLRYYPIDISSAALAASNDELSQKYPALTVRTIHAEYFDGMEHLAAISSEPKLILFLGSNIGNFEPAEAVVFLSEIRKKMHADDRLLVGVDMVKECSVLEAAYDDAQGVTAAFNLNVLKRINRELGGNIDLSAFHHVSYFNPALSRIEMHLESLKDQIVTIGVLGRSFSFAQGETIHTENSYKYTEEALEQLFTKAGLTLCEQWTDDRRYFTVNLLQPNRA